MLNHFKVFAALLCICTVASAEDPVYKSRQKNGQVVYSSAPDAKAVEVIVLPPIPEKTGVMLLTPEQTSQINDRVRSNLAERNKRYENMLETEAKVRQAEKAKDEGIEPGVGERQRLKNGKAKLNDKYWERQEELEKDLEKARSEADKARAGIN